jgi:hypothetical protein
MFKIGFSKLFGYILGFCLCINPWEMVFSSDPNSILKNLFSSPKFSPLNTAAKEFYLSEDEKQIIALFNLARYDGRVFVNEIINKSGYDTSLIEVSNLKKELLAKKSTFPLMPAFSLYMAAMVHAKDMGTSGFIGHQGSDGKSFKDRVHQYLNTNTEVAENFYIGSGDPIDVVMYFLLEKGEAGSEYKRNILNENIHYVGISIKPHRLKCTNVVVDFAQKPNIPPISSEMRKKNSVDVYWKDCPTGIKVSTRRKTGGFSLAGFFGIRRK